MLPAAPMSEGEPKAAAPMPEGESKAERRRRKKLEKRQAEKRRRSGLRGADELQKDVRAAEAMLGHGSFAPLQQHPRGPRPEPQQQRQKPGEEQAQCRRRARSAQAFLASGVFIRWLLLLLVAAWDAGHPHHRWHLRRHHITSSPCVHDPIMTVLTLA